MDSDGEHRWLADEIVALLNAAGRRGVMLIEQEDHMRYPGIDKIYHIVAYGLTTLFFILSLKNSLSLFMVVMIFFTFSSFGIIDELTQTLVNRTTSILDWLGDIIGITIVLFSFFYLQRSKC